MKAARHSIHLQYFIWGDDFTEELKKILVERAKAGVEVRLLYDPSARKLMSRAYVGT